MAEALTARRQIGTRIFGYGLLLVMFPLVAVLFIGSQEIASAQVRENPQSLPRKTQSARPLDPMNRPMEELGVTGHDATLCSDRWYTCSSYDRQQFDQKYPGRPLNELLRYGEPDWPDRDRSNPDSFDDQDRLDKD